MCQACPLSQTVKILGTPRDDTRRQEVIDDGVRSMKKRDVLKENLMKLVDEARTLAEEKGIFTETWAYERQVQEEQRRQNKKWQRMLDMGDASLLDSLRGSSCDTDVDCHGRGHCLSGVCSCVLAFTGRQCSHPLAVASSKLGLNNLDFIYLGYSKEILDDRGFEIEMHSRGTCHIVWLDGKFDEKTLLGIKGRTKSSTIVVVGKMFGSEKETVGLISDNGLYKKSDMRFMFGKILSSGSGNSLPPRDFLTFVSDQFDTDDESLLILSLILGMNICGQVRLHVHEHLTRETLHGRRLLECPTALPRTSSGCQLVKHLIETRLLGLEVYS